MSRVCDRCAGKNVVAKYLEKIEGQEIDLCVDCNDAFASFLSSKDQDETPKRGRPPKSAS